MSIVALTNLSCSSNGGDDETSSGHDSPTVSTVYGMDEVANEITTTMGEDTGLGAVLLAIDKGYSLRQTVDAIMTGTLQYDGNIMDEKGSIEYPENLPLNVTGATESPGRNVQLVKMDEKGSIEYPENLPLRLEESRFINKFIFFNSRTSR